MPSSSALGIISGSIAVLSDAIDSGTDLVGGTAALISVRVAIWPADEDHPYGHGKVESISASVAATVVAIGCGFVVFQAVRRLVEGSPEINVVVGLAPMIVAALANLVLAYYMRREARSSQSLALASESTHLQTNVVQAMAVIAGLTAVAITNERLFDPLVALGLAAYMAWTAVHLAREALSEIMDVALPDDELRAIHDAIAAHTDDIRGFHRLRSRRAGPTRHVDMHLIVDRPAHGGGGAHRLRRDRAGDPGAPAGSGGDDPPGAGRRPLPRPAGAHPARAGIVERQRYAECSMLRPHR